MSDRIPLGSKVRHRDAKHVPDDKALVGTLTHRIKSSVGAPRMVRVQWNERYSAPVNERNLIVVEES